MLVSPNIIVNLLNFFFPNALVKIFAIFSFVEECRRWIVFGLNLMSNQMVFCTSFDQMVLLCFVRSWNFVFLANYIAEVLLIKGGVECTCFFVKSYRIFLNCTISFVASAAATYSASVVEFVKTNCLCDLQKTNSNPRLIT